jgi:endonuclease/exonuclease/phosphatase (EEP) superfamily protein YafD
LQLSNVPEIRPARRLLIIGSVLFVVLFVLNLTATVISFGHHDTDRWLNAARLVPNLVIAVLLWRGYVQLAVLAERAEIYKQAIEKDLPRLRAAVERRERASGGDAGDPAEPDSD